MKTGAAIQAYQDPMFAGAGHNGWFMIVGVFVLKGGGLYCTEFYKKVPKCIFQKQNVN